MNRKGILAITAVFFLVFTNILFSREDQTMNEPFGDAIEGIQFPNVRGSNLQGQPFNLPGEFEGELNIILVAFQREQQRDINTWLPVVQRIHDEMNHVAFYELPTIRNMNIVYQWFINQGMRSGIPDSTARHTTITLYLDKEQFCQSLGIESQDQIHVFVVTQDGRVMWRDSGIHTLEKEKSLIEMIKSL